VASIAELAEVNAAVTEPTAVMAETWDAMEVACMPTLLNWALVVTKSDELLLEKVGFYTST